MSTLRDKTEAPIVVYPKPTPRQQNRAKLCEALRSGRYKQAYGHRVGRLKTFWRRRPIACVLGVGVIIGLWSEDTEDMYGHSRTKLGLPSGGPTLSYLNDHGWSFSKIADYIESLP